MRIASYNLWNSSQDWQRRLAAIADELVALDADVVAMQEAVTWASDALLIVDFFLERTHYAHGLHREDPDTPVEGERPEGLAVLSKDPLELLAVAWTINSSAMKVAFEGLGTSIGLTDLHLDWQHPEGHEQAIGQILREVVEQRPCDHELLLGDFNEAADGPAASALAAYASIGDLTGWRDLAREAGGEGASVTIGFAGSPREHEPGTPSERFDRIYLASRGAAVPPRLVGAGVFGQQPTGTSSVTASDHLGVFVDIDETAR